MPLDESSCWSHFLIWIPYNSLIRAEGEGIIAVTHPEDGVVAGMSSLNIDCDAGERGRKPMVNRALTAKRPKEKGGMRGRGEKGTRENYP